MRFRSRLFLALHDGFGGRVAEPLSAMICWKRVDILRILHSKRVFTPEGTN